MSYILDALRKSEQERMRGKLPDLKNFGEDENRRVGNYRLAWLIGGGLLALNAVGMSVWLMRTPAETPQVAHEKVSTASADKQTTVAQTVPTAPTNATQAPQPTSQPVVTSAPPTVSAQGGVPQAVQPPPNATYITTTPPPGTVYYVAPSNAVPGQQIVVLPSGAVQATPTGNVVVMPSGTPPATQSWENSTSSVPPPPPAPPPPPPVNLDQTLDAAGVGSMPTVSYLPQLDELPPQIRQQIPDMAFSSHMYSSMAKFRSVVINGNRVKEGEVVGNNIQVREITETGVILSLGDTQFQVDVLGKWSQ